MFRCELASRPRSAREPFRGLATRGAFGDGAPTDVRNDAFEADSLADAGQIYAPAWLGNDQTRYGCIVAHAAAMA